MLPIRWAQLEAKGTTLATGLPRLVMTIPSGSRWSRTERHCALNWDAFIWDIAIPVYYWSY
jgi:hypothetical protein